MQSASTYHSKSTSAGFSSGGASSNRTNEPIRKNEREKIVEILNITRSKRLKTERQLSPHVSSRYFVLWGNPDLSFHSPEIILMDKNYTMKTDIWSIGCILGELLNFSDYLKGTGRAPLKRVLFISDSCYPLSPHKDVQSIGS